MKELITIALIFTTLFTVPENDRELAIQYAEEHYKTAEVEFVRNATEKDITERNGKVLVEVIDTESHGEYGLDENGCYVSYNKTVPVGKYVTSYIIYNPETNGIDDVVAVVDNGEIR